MKRILIALLVVACTAFGAGDIQAQTKKKSSSKSKTTATSKTKKKKSEAKPATPTVREVELPYNCNDCLFAIPLELDKPYGPTSAPFGGGRMQEVVADRAHPNLFEREHNSVWYKVSIPYNGQLEISIEQRDLWDDYDFLVYRNTGAYFSNQVLQNKVMPVAVNLGMVDSSALAAAALAAAQKQAAKKKSTSGSSSAQGSSTSTSASKSTGSNASKKSSAAKASGNEKSTSPVPLPEEGKPTIGMSVDAKDIMLTKKQHGGFIKSIPVRMGEEYYIVLDNVSNTGKGHTITVSVHVDAYEPLVLFYDKKGRRYVDVNLMILEKGGSGGERPVVQDEHYRGGKVKFVPGFNYTVYAKKEGYFSIYREFNSRDLMMRDTIMLYQMERTERGTTFGVKNIYFDDDKKTLIGNPDTVLMDYVAMFLNHPDVTFLVKGYVNSYGVDTEADILVSLERAKIVKEYFVQHGIKADRITTAGMTRNEIKRTASSVLDKGEHFSDVRVELIITGVK